MELHIGFESRSFLSPNKKYRVDWVFLYEPPHGDGVFGIVINGERLQGEFWGRNIVWSDDGKHLAVERKDLTTSTLCVIDLETNSVVPMVERSSAIQFQKGQLHFKRYGQLTPEVISVDA